MAAPTHRPSGPGGRLNCLAASHGRCTPYHPAARECSVSANPYAPPLGSPAPLVAEPSGAAVVRRQYLSHEASVRSIGVLYYVGSVLLLTAGAVMLYFAIAADGLSPEERAPDFGLGIAYLVFATLQGAAGYGLRRLRRWAKPIAVVFSIIGLLAVPLGTIISGYILYLLLSRKGSVVFSDHYQHVIAKTPEIRYKSSLLVLVLLAVLITVAIVSIIAAFAIA